MHKENGSLSDSCHDEKSNQRAETGCIDIQGIINDGLKMWELSGPIMPVIVFLMDLFI